MDDSSSHKEERDGMGFVEVGNEGANERLSKSEEAEEDVGLKEGADDDDIQGEVRKVFYRKTIGSEGLDEDVGIDDGSNADDDDDEEEEEPALKYERLGGPTSDLLQRDNASAISVSAKFIAFGTHSGLLHIVNYTGDRIRSFKPHGASINDISIDSTENFIGTASIDGGVSVNSMSNSDSYSFDIRRPVQTIALDPQFAKNSSRMFVCGGLAGNLIIYERGWLGYKDRVLHSGEGPIWTSKWQGNLIAWANDLGVKIYDQEYQARITYIDRPKGSPRPDLFKCSLSWQDDSTLLIAWADYIKVARIRARPRTAPGSSSLPPLYAEVTAAFQLDCMISGIVPHPTPSSSTISVSNAPKSFLVLAYTVSDKVINEVTVDRSEQTRKAASRPELRIITRRGEELSSDELSLPGYPLFQCNDYCLVQAEGFSGQCHVVLSPKNIVLVRLRDKKDHVNWLIERKRFEEALDIAESLKDEGVEIDANAIGQQYIEYTFTEGKYDKAAHLCPKVFGQNALLWEKWVFRFAQHHQLETVIPYVPTDTLQLNHLVYEMILAHYLAHNAQNLLRTIKSWPNTVYDISAVIIAVQAELDRVPSTSPRGILLMDCLAELYIANRQPGKALPFLLRLRRPHVFDLIRENNLFTDVQDQALLLVEFDQELMEKKKVHEKVPVRSVAIALLVDHTHSIPVTRVVQQLQPRPYFLYLYLDALFEKDPQLMWDFSDLQVAFIIISIVKLYAEFRPGRLIDFLRTSSHYSLEEAYSICQERDLVPEMVFLLGRMGNNKKALYLIIDRLNDVSRASKLTIQAIDFAKEQNDDELWEDLLRYSETRPKFIHVLLENIGAQIDPIRLIRRIKNGLEIPGLRGALVKILQDFNVQISLLDGCQTILHSDCDDLSRRLQKNQTNGFFENGEILLGMVLYQIDSYQPAVSTCPICSLPLYNSSSSITMLFLCRHVVHASCVKCGDGLPRSYNPAVLSMGSLDRELNDKIALTALVRSRLPQGCPGGFLPSKSIFFKPTHSVRIYAYLEFLD
ncbi:hypothetical protein Clacol_004759 [Clathrus columnatus]|uniref:Vacuolar protein sorting-associated protein 41 n=1 Tax=Clathrus columnatus TaxID=1419009 RepID=A0AAV5A7D4_9AGAM|nr:hypothetical protein Clacol_004759 [Clathrus columnatus]